MRLIDADAFKQRNERLLKCDFPYISEETLEELLDDAPTIEEQKKGFWEWVDDMDYRCSVCHKYAYGCLGEVLSGHYKYCPYCGSAMEGEEDENDN